MSVSSSTPLNSSLDDGLFRQVSGTQPLLRTTLSDAAKRTESRGPPPKDPFGFVTFTMFLFGIASLLPWNFFITANDYWMYKFRTVNTSANSTSTDTNSIQRSFNSYLAMASKIPYILLLVVNTIIAKKVRCSVRIGYPLFICIVLFIATSALVKVDTDQFQRLFLFLTLGIVVLINVVCAFLQGGGTGFAGVLPSKYMATNVMGQASGGVFATVCQIACLLLDVHPTDSALAYFSIATILLILTQICFAIIIKLDFYKYYMVDQRPSPLASSYIKAKSASTPFWQIFKSGWKFHISTTLIFWITLAVFPAITVLIRSQHADGGSLLTGKLFIPLSCFLMFNCCDLLGRMIAKFVPISSDWSWSILFLAICRLCFVPLFLICNAAPNNRILTPILLTQDWHYFLIMTFFGISNGYITTLTLTYGAKSCGPEHQEVAGGICAVFLGLGLALGSMSSYLTIQLL